MPKKKNAQEGPAEDSALVSAAKSIGTAAGKVASAIGVKREPHQTPKAARRGKPVKSNKPRLPRKQKKALKKAAEQAEKARTGAQRS
jgi:hypothetical protein